MKINNKKNVRLKFVFYLIITLFCVAAVLGIHLFSGTFLKTSQFFCYFGIMFLGFRIIDLKLIEIECSGEVLMVQTYSILGKDIFRKHLEMPCQDIVRIYFQKSFFYNFLIIDFYKENKANKKIHFQLNNIAKKDQINLQENLIFLQHS